MKMTEEQMRTQIERLNAKIQFQLEEYEAIINKMTGRKNDPDMIVFHNYSRQIIQVETELNMLLTEKKIYEQIVG